jgi:hypothetical protein
MAKKNNPWTKALKEKKAPVDLHPDVLRAVLRVNPQMRGGDRSTEQVAEGLMADLPSTQKAAAIPPEARSLLRDGIALLGADLNADMKDIERARSELAAREAAVRERHLARLVDLLARHAPGALSAQTRELLQTNIELRRALRVEVSDIQRLINKKTGNA